MSSTPSYRTCLGSTPHAVLDEVVEVVADFLSRHIIDEGLNYEVEAKFGTLLDRHSDQRIALPVMNTCVIAPGDWYRFESLMTVEQHRHYNNLFNGLVTASNASGDGRWKYKREKTIDSFQVVGPQRRSMRVSRDATTGRVLAVIEKRRVADLAIHVPASPFDVRISVNLETEMPLATSEALPPSSPTHLANGWVVGEGEPSDFARVKNRLAYTFDGLLRIDLTQVHQEADGGGHAGVRHEMELEVVHVQAHLGDSSSLPARFVYNILDIARRAP